LPWARAVFAQWVRLLPRACATPALRHHWHGPKRREIAAIPQHLQLLQREDHE
ncbi:unnamed protein product, partial [Symbiodinium sp. CCMP2456]